MEEKSNKVTTDSQVVNLWGNSLLSNLVAAVQTIRVTTAEEVEAEWAGADLI